MTDPDDFSPMVCPECLSRYEADCLSCIDCRVSLEYRPVTGLRSDGKLWEAPKPQTGRGGARPNSGPKAKHGPTVTVRVPVWFKDRIPQLVHDHDTGNVVRADEARRLLVEHLEQLTSKQHPKRSVIQHALLLLGEGADLSLDEAAPRSAHRGESQNTQQSP